MSLNSLLKIICIFSLQGFAEGSKRLYYQLQGQGFKKLTCDARLEMRSSSRYPSEQLNKLNALAPGNFISMSVVGGADDVSCETKKKGMPLKDLGAQGILESWLGIAQEACELYFSAHYRNSIRDLEKSRSKMTKVDHNWNTYPPVKIRYKDEVMNIVPFISANGQFYKSVASTSKMRANTTYAFQMRGHENVLTRISTDVLDFQTKQT